MEVDDKPHPSTQIHGRNQRKTLQIARSKIRPKIPPKITKKKNIAAWGRRWSDPKAKLY
jgi:hypothetical protein